MRFLVQRLMFYIAAFMVAVTLNFFIPRLMPGDPATILFMSLQGRIKQDQLAALKRSFGFDGTIWDQFVIHIGKLIHLDFNTSTINFPEPTASLLFYATLPVASIVIVNFGSWHPGMRNTMINLLNEDFVVLAKAKGLSDRQIRNGYVARNAILPQITSLAMSFGFVQGGALITEVVFNYPGLGKLTPSAIQSRDYSFIQAQLLLLTFSVLVANLISDVLNVIFDLPRVRPSGWPVKAAAASLRSSLPWPA